MTYTLEVEAPDDEQTQRELVLYVKVLQDGDVLTTFRGSFARAAGNPSILASIRKRAQEYVRAVEGNESANRAQQIAEALQGEVVSR